MKLKKQFEILNGLPPYGDMYVSVSDSEEKNYSEGFVIRFFKSDNTSWVANFALGWNNFSKVFDFPEYNTVVVIAGGQGYVMTPDEEKPKFTFGMTILEVLQTENNSLIFSDDLGILFFDNSNGDFWISERISWDGLVELSVCDNILKGKSYDPLDSEKDSWVDFSVNLITKEIQGGSYRIFLKQNPHFETGENGILKEESKKSWWKFW